ncbi:MAG TPA: hypothetical protein VLD16_15230 [Gaiellaceae bacterium]|nr:hypothetical protein [Gaiellaceae bacterium]
MTLWEERAARNEVVFRQVNEEVASLGPGSASVASFVCECSDASCIERIDVPLDAYEAVRASPRRFVVRPGHERSELEQVVDRRDGYLVVEKVGDAGAVAERTAPRSSDD